MDNNACVNERQRIMASYKVICTSFFLIVVAAASPMMFGLHDFPRSIWERVLPIWAMLVTKLHPLFAVASVMFAYLLLKVCRVIFAPLQMRRTLHEIGYIPDGERSLKDIANDVRNRRKLGDIPPVYPNGWFQVVTSQELNPGEVKYVCMLGEQLAVFRGNDGIAHVVDAYCPHLGANLGVGGQVVGNCIQCPFHGWIFNGEDGKCVKIPYSDKVPDFAKTKAWLCLERNQAIYIWYHAEGIEPTWTPDEIEEIADGSWIYRGYTQHIINAHIEEVPENGADVTHLDHLHGSPIIAGTDLRYSFSDWWHFARHKWTAQWEALSDKDKHVGCLSISHALFLFGYKVPYTDLHMTARQTGPGLVCMRFTSSFGDGIFLQCLTPKEPLLQCMQHHLFASSYMPNFIAKFLLYAEAIQVERDIMIWNHKTYVSKPLLVKEDQLIRKHRRWYSQFYSENSPRLSFKKNNSDLEW